VNDSSERVDLPPAVVVPILFLLIGTLHLAGPGAALPSPVLSAEAWERWGDAEAPVGLAFAVLRSLALVTCYHLLAMQLVAMVASVVDRPGLLALANRFTPPPLRTSARRLAGIGLTAVTSMTASTAIAGASEPAPGTAVLQVIDVGPGSGTAVIRVETAGVTEEADAAPAAEPDTAPATAPTAEPARQRVVEPGDHLWSIARAEVAAATGEALDPAIERYWERLVLANPQLIDADLVFPGDVIVLPPLGQTG